MIDPPFTSAPRQDHFEAVVGSSLAARTIEALRAEFRRDIIAGTRRPWIMLPLGVLATMLLPVLYLAVPHTNRPWLYTARWAVIAVVVGCSVESLLVARASSLNVFSAYISGIVSLVSVFWALIHLVFTQPQLEAERVTRRRRYDSLQTGEKPPVRMTDLGDVMETATTLSLRTGSGNEDTSHATGVEKSIGGSLTGPRPHSADARLEKSPRQTRDTERNALLRDGMNGHFQYYWQAFPADLPFSDRFEWALDLYTSYRGAGWNGARSTSPRYARPIKPLSGEPVDLRSMPARSRDGYVAYTSLKHLLRAKLTTVACCYLASDACAILLTEDPYFVLGPPYLSPSSSLRPSFLAHLPPYLLTPWRKLLTITSAYIALQMTFSLFDLIDVFLIGRALGWAAWADVSRYTSVFGSFTAGVLDRGLVGFWGSWWHQTFHIIFTSPTRWLVKIGWLPSRRQNPAAYFAASTIIAFLMSGTLHAAGSYSSLRSHTRWWLPPVFFLLSAVGVALQDALARLIRLAGGGSSTLQLHRSSAIRRTGNLVFVLVWLQLTAEFIVDDFAASGLFLGELLPFSPLRWLGFSRSDNRSWRWDRDMFPSFYVGRHWWEYGIAS